MRIPTSPVNRRRRGGSALSPGAWIILVIACVSGVMLLMRPTAYTDHELEFWVFADPHYAMYTDLLDHTWNPAHQPIPGQPNSGNRVLAIHLTTNAEQQRMLSGFYSETPMADLMEIERARVGALFALPLEEIGLYDLTAKLKEKDKDGLSLLDKINEPSFSPWTSRGHIFGLPHDIHPVMLLYRADIVEAAGIDVTQIETWDDYVRLMAPLMKDLDDQKPNPRPKHYLLNLYPEGIDQIEMLLLQNNGRYFDENGVPDINTPQNAQVLAQVVLWCSEKTLNEGGTGIGYKAPEFNNGADNERVEGKIIGTLAPDWLVGMYQRNIPQLSGKLKLMPLPAWEKGGRRTSIWGGTMLAISRRTHDFDRAWSFAKELYTSPAIAEKLYKDSGIVSPVKSMWPSKIYDEPVPFVSGQPRGRLFLNLAKDVPLRTSSPFHELARSLLGNAVLHLETYATDNHITALEPLQKQAQEMLDDINAQLNKAIRQDLFIDPKIELEAMKDGGKKE